MNPIIAAADVARDFYNWWIDELTVAVSPPPGTMAGHGRRQVLVVSPESGGATIHAARNRRIETLTPAPLPLDDLVPFLREHVGTSRTPVGVRLHMRDCFVRRLELPARVRRDLPRVLALELERSSPFKPDSVYTGFVVEHDRPVGASIRVRQFIIKRRPVDAIISRLRDDGTEITFVDLWDEQGHPAPLVNFLPAEAKKIANTAGTLRRLTAACAVLLLSSAVLTGLVRQSELYRLREEIVRLTPAAEAAADALRRKREAEAGQQALDRLLHARPLAAAVLDDLSQLIPNSVWLREFRLAGDVIEIAGSATSAAQLMPLLERSGVYTDAHLTAPVRLDEHDRETFRIRLRLKTHDMENRLHAVEAMIK